MSKRPIYLDYAATTPVDPRVKDEMWKYLGSDGEFGNPASRSHIYGWFAEQAVEGARRDLADLLNADPREIIWTSGATEADNLAIKGVAEGYRSSGKHIVTSAIEHKAVLDCCRYLERQGFVVTYLRPDQNGLIHPDQVAQAITDDTILVSLMHGNNEIGTLTDIGAIGAIARERGVLFHVDAAQTVGKEPIDVQAMQVDMLSVSAHKIYGPKGVGALYIRRRPRIRLQPQIHGGGHEQGYRSGTLATHQIVGLGQAVKLAAEEMHAEHERLLGLRERLWQGIADLPGVSLNGDAEHRLANNLNLSFAGCQGETLMLALNQIAVSSGSACNSASMEPSYVLTGIGLPADIADSALRISLGRFTTEAEIDQTIPHIREKVLNLNS